jgi:periplasmic copper chaperone A
LKRRYFLALTFLPTMAFAHSAKLGDIYIGHPWSLPSATSETAAMMALLNDGAAPDSLIGARTTIAKSVELRNASKTVPEFAINSKKPLPMRPAAFHLQLLGLTKPLRKGDMFPLTLKFKNAGEIELMIHVADGPGN